MSNVASTVPRHEMKSSRARIFYPKTASRATGVIENNLCQPATNFIYKKITGYFLYKLVKLVACSPNGQRGKCMSAG